jgi:tetratricopeptide (TPR) repeat protein
MSHLATWQGAPRTGLDHAVAAQGWAEQADDLLLKAYAHQVAARAYAADGQMTALRELDRAEALIGAASPNPGSVVHFNNGAQLAADRSECYLSLGDLVQAASTARHALALQEPSFVRNRAFASLYLGRVCLCGNQVEEAAAVIGDAVDLTAQNRSPRLVTQLRQSLAEFAPWQDAREARDLRARCDAAWITEGVWPG